MVLSVRRDPPCSANAIGDLRENLEGGGPAGPGLLAHALHPERTVCADARQFREMASPVRDGTEPA